MVLPWIQSTWVSLDNISPNMTLMHLPSLILASLRNKLPTTTSISEHYFLGAPYMTGQHNAPKGTYMWVVLLYSCLTDFLSIVGKDLMTPPNKESLAHCDSPMPVANYPLFSHTGLHLVGMDPTHLIHDYDTTCTVTQTLCSFSEPYALNNSGWRNNDGDHGDCSQWAQSHGLTNPLYQLALDTQTPIVTRLTHTGRGTQIDHILTSGHSLHCLSFLQPSDVQLLSDHIPLLACFNTTIHLGPKRRPPPIPRHRDLDLKNIKVTQLFLDQLTTIPMITPNTPQHAADILHQYCLDIVSSAHRVTSSKASTKCFQGWSPQFIAAKYYLQFLHRILSYTDSILRHEKTNEWNLMHCSLRD